MQSKKITDVLNQISEDVLTEDSKKMLTEAFEQAVQVAVTEKVGLEVNSALERLDEEYTQKLTQLLEAIDVDHSKKLTTILQRIDEDHTEKLEYLVRKHDAVLNEDAKNFKDSLIDQLSNYLDLYLEKTIPHEQLREAVENTRARKIVDQIKEFVSIDDEYVTGVIREAVEDGRKTISQLQQELNEAVKSNIELAQKAKHVKAELVLEQSTKNLPADKKQYVMRTLKGKDPEYITENIDYVVKMFEKEEDERRSLISEEAKKDAMAVKGKLDTPKQVLTESKGSSESNTPGEGVSGYLSAMERQDRFLKK